MTGIRVIVEFSHHQRLTQWCWLRFISWWMSVVGVWVWVCERQVKFRSKLLVRYRNLDEIHGSVYGYFIMEKQILSGRPSNEQVGALNGRETPVAYSCDDAVQVSTQYYSSSGWTHWQKGSVLSFGAKIMSSIAPHACDYSSQNMK